MLVIQVCQYVFVLMMVEILSNYEAVHLFTETI